MKNTYSKRVWLNKNNSPSTGSVVAYHGPSSWGDSGEDNITFLEVASCHEKVRLHLTERDTKQDFIKKMTLLRNTIDDFINYIQGQDL